MLQPPETPAFGKDLSLTLFYKYGGFSTISKVVMAFYDRILDSDQVGDYFEDIDMKRLIDHQTKFVASIMGDSASFSDDMLKCVHARYEISREDFDEVARLLRETLTEFGVEHDDIETVMLRSKPEVWSLFPAEGPTERHESGIVQSSVAGIDRHRSCRR